MNGAVSHVKELSDFSDTYLWTSDVPVDLMLVKLIKFLRKQLKGSLSQSSSPIFAFSSSLSI